MNELLSNLMTNNLDANRILFYVFAFFAFSSAFVAIFVRNSVRAVLSLVLCFICTAAIWLLLESEFLALVLVLVYVGAVMVLFLFVVMMLDVDLASLRGGLAKFFPIGLSAAIIFFIGLFYALKSLPFSQTIFQSFKAPANYNQVKRLGVVLYTEYLFALEVAGILLLVAMIAAISLTFRGRQGSKEADVSLQNSVQKKDRLTLLKKLPDNPLTFFSISNDPPSLKQSKGAV